MLAVLGHPVFQRLFAAQAIALVGTGLMTVALALLAFDLAGADAGVVIGVALAIKMAAYVGLAPLAAAAVERLPRKAVLIGADLVRASVALLLPFIDAVWQIYALIFALQAASATFTPAFQATIPDVLPDEKRYTAALALSRLAYDIENLASPAIASLLLAAMSYHWLFGGTFLGFLVSALLVSATTLPAIRQAASEQRYWERATHGVRLYLKTPRLRGLLALTLAAAAASAFVLVDTVVLVRAEYGFGERALAYALAAYGGGSMAAALLTPLVLERASDRTAMRAAGLVLAVTTLGYGLHLAVVGLTGWPAFLFVWATLGFFYSAVLTPAGRLLRRSADAADRPGLFAAQFALSHVCWLAAYPIAGSVGAAFGLGVAAIVLGLLALAGALVAAVLWAPEDGA